MVSVLLFPHPIPSRYAHLCFQAAPELYEVVLDDLIFALVHLQIPHRFQMLLSRKMFAAPIPSSPPLEGLLNAIIRGKVLRRYSA